LEKLEKSANKLKKSNETIEGACKRETEILKKICGRAGTSTDQRAISRRSTRANVGRKRKWTEEEQRNNRQYVQERNGNLKEIIETLGKKVIASASKSTARDRKTQDPARVINVSKKITGDREVEQAQLRKLFGLLGKPK